MSKIVDPETRFMNAAQKEQKEAEQASKKQINEAKRLKISSLAEATNKEFESLTKEEAELILDESGNTLVHLAAQNGNTALLDHLIGMEVDLNFQNGKGDTVLHMATRIAINKQDSTLFKYFIEGLNKSGVNLNVQNSLGDTALHIAAKAVNNYGSTALLSLLANNNADLNLQNNSGKTALHIAADEASKTHESVKILLLDEDGDKRAINATITDNVQKTPLDYAIERGTIESVELLIDTTPDLTTERKKAILAQAAKDREEEDVEKIAKKLGFEMSKEDIKQYYNKINTPIASVAPPAPTENSDTPPKPTQDSKSLPIASQDENNPHSKPSEAVDLKNKKEEFLKKLKAEYGSVFNQEVLAKVTEYVNHAKLKEGTIEHDNTEYKSYEKGNARKGKSHKFAELISGIRKTDNEMIQELAKQFKDFATKGNHQVSLPKRYPKKQSTQSK